MDEKTKKEFILLFNQGFEEVVVPAIEDLREEMTQEFRGVKQQLSQVENRLDKVEGRLESLEVKVDTITLNQFDDKQQLRDHEKRIKKLEVSRIAA